jgi:hypothetical protein
MRFVFAVLALVLSGLAYSPRDSLWARWDHGQPWEILTLVALIVVFALGLYWSYRSFGWRVFWCLLLIVIASGTTHNVRLERAVMGMMLLGFLVVYRRFLGKFAIYLIGHLMQSSILLLFLCLLYGWIGTSYGVPNLFWSETFGGRFWAAFGATLLLAVLGVNSFFLDDNYHSNWEGARDFLRVWKVSWWSPTEVWLRGLDVWETLRQKRVVWKPFAANPNFHFFFGDPDDSDDPNKAVPEPRYGSMISSLLRTGRLPMLTLIALPALFPLLFRYVPRQAPREVPIFLAFLDPSLFNETPDVGRNLRAWLLGVVCWGSGTLTGLFFVKPLIHLNMWVEARIAELMGGRLGTDLRVLWRAVSSPPALVFWGFFVLLALAGAIALDAGWWQPPDNSWLQCFHLATVVLTCGFAVVLSGFRARQLRPRRCLPFLRFLFVCASTFSLIAIYDLSIRATGLDKLWDIAVAPGLAVCVLLATLAILAGWVSLLRPVRDGHRKWIATLRAHHNQAVLRWQFVRAGKLDQEIALYQAIASNRFHSELLALAVLVVWVGLMNAADFKQRFEALPYDREPLTNWRQVVQAYRDWGREFEENKQPQAIREVPELLGDRNTLEAWRRHVWSLTPRGRAKPNDVPKEFRPKLVVACATGGASRAAYWTARVLQRLGADIRRTDDGEQPDFHEAVRVITGASGGMVGAAHYVVHRNQVPEQARRDGSWAADEDWIRNMPTENLRAVASHIAFASVVQALLPRLPHPFDLDRGEVLEMQWPRLAVPLSSLRDAERRGVLPSLVFTPVTVDDGRRLLISNLGLHRLAVSRGSEIEAGGTQYSVYSVALPEFYRAFGADANALSVATAVRMSATFPMVSPAVNLPTTPPVRIVDAGYYDNYGVNVAVAWLFHNRQWLMNHTSGVALVQIRAAMGRSERLGPPRVPGASAMDGLQVVSTPFDAFAGMRESMPIFRNDEEVAALAEVFFQESGDDEFFTSVVFENSAQVLFDVRTNGHGTASQNDWPMDNAEQRINEAPTVTDVAMTWYLSRAEKLSMDRAIPSDHLARTTKLADAKLIRCSPNDPRSLFHQPADRVRWLVQESSRSSKSTPFSAGVVAAFRHKELERALNYERIQAFRAWWKRRYRDRPASTLAPKQNPQHQEPHADSHAGDRGVQRPQGRQAEVLAQQGHQRARHDEEAHPPAPEQR